MILSLACALAATAARAIRLPNDFAEAHWLLDYRYGFIKRGLAGSVLNLAVRLGLHVSAATIAWIAGIVFTALIVALLAISGRILARLEWSTAGYLALAAFATSPFVVTTAHLMGYLDHLMFLLTFAAVWLALERRFAAAGFVAAAATLVHESFAVVGLPLVALAALSRARGTRATLAALAGTVGPPAVACASLVITEAFLTDRAQLRAQLVHRLSRFGFLEKDMPVFLPEWLTTTAVENLREEAHRFPWRVTDPQFVRLVVPTAAVVWIVATVSRGKTSAAGSRRLWPWLSLAAIAAPLLLHLLAWDTARIWTYPLLAAFAGLWIGVEAREDAPLRPQPWIAWLACAVIALNVFSRYPLLDYQTERFTDGERVLLYAPFVIISLVALRRPARPT